MADKTPKVPDFVAKLYEILEDSQNSDIIAWNEAEFAIKNTEALVKEVLPKYYRHSKLELFIRQLNLYGFRKVSKPSQKEYLFFKNDIFRQGAPELLHKIQLKSKEKRSSGKDKTEDIR